MATSVYKRRRRLSTNSGRDSKDPSGQCTWRWCQTPRYRLRIFLLLFGLLAAPLLGAASPSSIDYGSLTWSKWSEIYTPVAADSIALRSIYRSGPRVRAKIMVSTQISMYALQAGEAIFRQHIREIVKVDTIDQVQMEYLQTDACSETEQGMHYVALGISALPPPQSSGNSYGPSASGLMLPAIEAERECIVEKLKYGAMLSTGNMTIDSLSLFSVPMSLVDIVLDGERFAQLYLKSWVRVQLVIASADNVTTGVSSSDTDHYTTDRNAFQDLHLRFLLAHRLQSLQVRVSDIIVHSSTGLLPFATYHAHAGVLEIEIHVHDSQYAEFVEMYLLGGDPNSPNTMPNNVVADTFNEMEPQWQLLALDVDTTAGELFSPVSEPSAPLSSNSNGDSNTASELTFAVYNISLVQLERTKWSVLDFMWSAIADAVSSRVRFGRIGFPSSSFALSSFATYNDGGDGAATEDGNSIFDPVNAINWTLSFKVEPEATDTFDSTALADHVTTIQSSVELGLQHALGFTTGTLINRSVTFQGASDWADPELSDANVVEPFATFILTIQVEPLVPSWMPRISFSYIMSAPHWYFCYNK